MNDGWKIWDIAIVVFVPLQCLALFFLALYALKIKNGAVKRVQGRVLPLVGKGKRLATAGKDLAESGKRHTPAILATVKAMTAKARVPAPEGMLVEYRHLQRAATLARTGVGGLALLRRGTKKRVRKPTKRSMVDRLGLVPPVARPLLRAVPVLKKVLPVVRKVISSRRNAPG
jgi:hypothetical protein